jgi:hypothetical protein
MPPAPVRTSRGLCVKVYASDEVYASDGRGLCVRRDWDFGGLCDSLSEGDGLQPVRNWFRIRAALAAEGSDVGAKRLSPQPVKPVPFKGKPSL